jgi:hypothetical protein
MTTTIHRCDGLLIDNIIINPYFLLKSLQLVLLSLRNIFKNIYEANNLLYKFQEFL